MTHVPYEFYQPYLNVLSEQGLLYGFSVPIISGLLYAGARYAGAFGAAYSMTLSRKFGMPLYLMGNLLIINLIVWAMGSALNSAIVLLVLLRSLPWAAIKAPVHALITPRIDAGQRATFHSMMSLAARLGFFLTLYLLSLIVEKSEMANWTNLSTLLMICFAGGMAFMIPLIFTARRAFGKSA